VRWRYYQKWIVPALIALSIVRNKRLSPYRERGPRAHSRRPRPRRRRGGQGSTSISIADRHGNFGSIPRRGCWRGGWWQRTAPQYFRPSPGKGPPNVLVGRPQHGGTNSTDVDRVQAFRIRIASEKCAARVKPGGRLLFVAAWARAGQRGVARWQIVSTVLASEFFLRRIQPEPQDRDMRVSKGFRHRSVGNRLHPRTRIRRYIYEEQQTPRLTRCDILRAVTVPSISRPSRFAELAKLLPVFAVGCSVLGAWRRNRLSQKLTTDCWRADSGGLGADDS